MASKMIEETTCEEFPAPTRRGFLQWLGVAPGAALLASGLVNAACGEEATSLGDGSDAGDSGNRDAGSDSAGGVDTAADLADTGNDQGVDGEVDADPVACETTASDVEGPFHIDGAPSRTVLAAADEPGVRLWISGRVMGPDCRTPVVGALLDIWQADEDGNYHDDTTDYRLRGQLLTDSEGRYAFETIQPGRYPLGGSTRPSHIHFMVTSPDHRPLTTQLYFAGDPFLMPDDPCGDTCNSDEPSLIIALTEVRRGEVDGLEGTFNIVLDEV